MPTPRTRPAKVSSRGTRKTTAQGMSHQKNHGMHTERKHAAPSRVQRKWKGEAKWTKPTHANTYTVQDPRTRGQKHHMPQQPHAQRTLSAQCCQGKPGPRHTFPTTHKTCSPTRVHTATRTGTTNPAAGRTHPLNPTGTYSTDTDKGTGQGPLACHTPITLPTPGPQGL